MNCAHARRLFSACWDDEITQAEREWLDAHFVACPRCRAEYEAWSRSLEALGSLPRVEPAPELLERVLARTRRVAPAPDRLGVPAFPWKPVTAAAALVALAATLVAPWVETGRTPGVATRPTAEPVVQPTLRAAGDAVPSPGHMSVPGARGASLDRSGRADLTASIPDSVFDHSEDVEFILDPVPLHRGRPSVVRARTGVQGQQATITF